MSMTLVCTWRPRGELTRFLRIRPQLESIYKGIIIVTPPDVQSEDVHPMSEQPGVTVITSPKPGWGRYVGIQGALDTSSQHIHYADLDRLLHWIELQADEWMQSIGVIQQTDCLIIGRTEQAFQTHPQALQQTESIINAVASHLLGQTVDVGGGTRGFSRHAAHVVINNSTPGHWGDAEWPILVHRAGLAVHYLEVNGLTWETPDHYKQYAADPNTSRAEADAYDQRVKSWVRRVETAREIVEEGLSAAQRPLLSKDSIDSRFKE
jgi:hypothetical protein